MATPEQIAVWDAEAAGYDEPADHGLRDPVVREAWRRLLADLLPTEAGRAADLGCGTGTLSALLAEAGWAVDAVDFSPAMVEQARAKTAHLPTVTVTEADACTPPLPDAAYDVVLCRHVLWAMPDPAVALGRWLRLLRPTGRLVLVEGSWSTGAGLSAAQTEALVRATGRPVQVRRLDDPAYWGGPTGDERYAVTSGPAVTEPGRNAG